MAKVFLEEVVVEVAVAAHIAEAALTKTVVTKTVRESKALHPETALQQA